MSCRVQGTGFLFFEKLVENGWNYTSLTEDRSFCSDAVVQGYRVSYCDEAVFYDEQPENLKVALRQRVRWAKGHLCSSVENCPKLLKNLFRKDRNFLVTYDTFFLNFPSTAESGARKVLKFGLELAIAVCAVTLFGFWKTFLVGVLWNIGKVFLKKAGVQILIYLRYGKRIAAAKSFWSRLHHACAFPLFDFVGRFATYVALFKKVEWKPVPHDKVVDVNELK